MNSIRGFTFTDQYLVRLFISLSFSLRSHSKPHLTSMKRSRSPSPVGKKGPGARYTNSVPRIQYGFPREMGAEIEDGERRLQDRIKNGRSPSGKKLGPLYTHSLPRIQYEFARKMGSEIEDEGKKKRSPSPRCTNNQFSTQMGRSPSPNCKERAVLFCRTPSTIAAGEKLFKLYIMHVQSYLACDERSKNWSNPDPSRPTNIHALIPQFSRQSWEPCPPDLEIRKVSFFLLIQSCYVCLLNSCFVLIKFWVLISMWGTDEFINLCLVMDIFWYPFSL